MADELVNRIELISDQAVGEGDKNRIDGLGFETYAQVLAQAAKDTVGPFTIGVFGEWGTGKTSLLRLIERRLTNDPDVITVWFNAWRYEKEDHPIVPFVFTIFKTLENNRDLLEKLGDAGGALLRGLRQIALGFKIKAGISIPFIGGVENETSFKEVVDAAKDTGSVEGLEESPYFAAFGALEKIDLQPKAKIVVIIDDLDRCLPERAVNLLETMKLVFSQPGFVFIFGVARTVIEGYLEHRFKVEYGLKQPGGQAYLDKMIQMPFHIPPHDQRMENFYRMLLDSVQAEHREAFEELIPIIGSACAYNPRATIRFMNNLLIDRVIYTTLFGTEESQISIGSFAIGRSLQIRWPEIHKLLIASTVLCDAFPEWLDGDNLKDIAAEEGSDKARLAKQVLADPYLKALLNSTYGREWLMDEGLRIRSTQFLESERASDETDAGPDKPTQSKIHAETGETSFKREPSAAFMRLMKLSPELAAVVGKESLPRTEVTKRIWDYIKQHDLQDRENRRLINADSKLQRIFGGKKQVSMFEMVKLVSKHMR